MCAHACTHTELQVQQVKKKKRRKKKRKSRDIFILLGAGYTSTINVPSSTHSPFGKVITMINKAAALCTTKPFVKEGKDWESITQPILTGAQTIHQTARARLLFHLFVSRLLLHVSLLFWMSLPHSRQWKVTIIQTHSSSTFHRPCISPCVTQELDCAVPLTVSRVDVLI